MIIIEIKANMFLIHKIFKVFNARKCIVISQHILSLKNKISIFTNTSARAGYDTRSIFNRSLTGLNSEFSFSKTSCLTKTEEPSLLYYLPIGGGRIIEFILCEMQLVASRI